MKDKQQRIEEMILDMFDYARTLVNIETATEDSNFINRYKEALRGYATWLVNANYQKVYENSVVLTEEEYEYFMKDRDYWQEQYHKENEKYIKFIGEKLPELLDNNGKETVEKIFKSFTLIDFMAYSNAKGELYWVDFLVWLDELAKQFGVNIKEN